MNKTNDFKFNLPAYSDPVDVADLNDNFIGIDDALMAGLCKKEYTGNNMGSSDPSARKYAWAPWFEIVNDNEFDVVVTDRNAPVESEEATINIVAGQTFRKYINGRYYMNFYVQDQHDVTFKWFTNAETYINESGGGGGGTGTVTSVSVQGGSGSHLTASGNPIETSGTITINIDEGYSIPQTLKQEAWDVKAADLKAEIDSSTYVLTLQLKDSSGNLIGNERTIDLPLETMVVDGEYDPQTKKIKLELKNGNYVEFSVADLVSGLQTELSASNKLDPDYIDYDASHRAVSDTEKDTWNGKQNALTFDDTPTQNSNNPVKSGGIYTALTGKQASLDSTQLAAVNSGIDSTKVAQISTNQTNILYAINTGVKNILPVDSCNVSAATYLLHDYEMNVPAGDYIFYINVTSTTATGIQVITSIGADDGQHRTGVKTIGLSTGTTGVISESMTVLAGTTCITLYVNSAANIPEIMLCPKQLWDTLDHTFRHSALPNSDLTYLEAEDRAALAEVVDSGAKNVLDFANLVLHATEQCNVTKTDTYVTTSSISSAYSNVRYKLVLKAGTYILAGKISNSSFATNTNGMVFISAQGSSPYTSLGAISEITGNGNYSCTVSVPTNGTYYLIVSPNWTATSSSTNTMTLSEVMICTKAAFGVSSRFVPYRVPINGVFWAEKYEARSTTLVSTGIKFTASKQTIYRITATAQYGNSKPTQLVIKKKLIPSESEGNFVAVSSDTNSQSLTATGIMTLGVGGYFEVYAAYDGTTSNRVCAIVEEVVL